MKELLLVGYHFPPIASIGALRPHRIAKYLSEFGWSVTVLTVGNDWRYKADPSFKSGDFQGYRIVRANRLPIHKIIRRLARKLSVHDVNWYTFLDEFYDWYPSAVSKGRKLLRENKFDAILATSPPFTTLRIARTLAKEFGLPAIADLRDPFTQNDFAALPTPLHKMFYSAYENRLLHSFDAITVAWDIIAKRNAKAFGIPETKFHVITNGFEPDVFTWLYDKTPPTDEFTIGYFGSLYGIRTAEYLFRALAEIFKKHPDMRKKIKIFFAGYLDEVNLRKLADKYRCDETLRFMGLLPRHQALEMMTSCSTLVLFTGMVSNSLPGKVFDYIASGRPILSFSKPGPLNDFMRAHQIGVSVDGDAPQEAAIVLLNWIKSHLSGKIFYELNSDKVQKFNARNLTQTLASILDETI